MAGRKPYRGTSKRSGGRTPYRGPQAANQERTPYRGQAINTDAPTPEHHGHGGFFGTVKHVATTVKDVPGHFAAGANRFAHQAIPGIELTAAAVKHDVSHEIRHNLAQPNFGLHAPRLPRHEDFKGSHLAPIAEASLQGLKHDVQHPLADPFSTVFDVFTFATPAVKLGATAAIAGRAAKAGDFAEAGKALVRPRPTPPSRVYEWQGATRNLPASRNPVVHLAQRKVIDPLRKRFPNTPIIGEAPTVGRIGNRDRRYADRQVAAQGAQLVQLGRQAGMLKRKGRVGTVTFDALVRQNALRLVAEETSPALRARRHQVWLAERDPRMSNPVRSKRKNPLVAEAADAQAVRGHRFQIRLNEATSRYVDDAANFTSEAKALGLDKVYAQAERLGLARELAFGDLASLGVKPLSEEAAAARVSAPGKLYRGADYKEPPKTNKAGEIVEPDWLLRARGGVAKLQKRYDQAVARTEKAGAAQVAKLNAPRNGGNPFAKPGNGTPAPIAPVAEALPAWAQQDAAYLAAKRADIKTMTEQGIDPNDSRWIGLVSSAGRQIKWSKFPDKRAAIVDWFENHVAPGHERKLERWRNEGNGTPAPVNELDVARARLTVLEQRHQAFQQVLEDQLFNRQARLDLGQTAEQRAKNTKAGKIRQRDSGKNKQGNVKGSSSPFRGRAEPTVNEELRAQGQAYFEKYLADHADEPVVKRYQAERVEMDELRAKLAPDVETLFERGHTPVRERAPVENGRRMSTEEAHALIGRLVTGPGKAVPAKGSATVEQLGGALSIAKHNLDLAEHRWELKQAFAAKPTGWVGSDFEGGRMYVPAAKEGRRKKLPQTSVGSTGAVNATPPAPASLTNRFRGLAYKSGAPRNDVLALLHENWQEAQRYVALLHNLDELKATASPTRRSKYDILMRTEKIEGQLPLQDAVQVAEEASRDDMLQARLAMQFEEVRQRVFPATAEGAAYKTLEPGVPYEAPAGYQWVDKRLVGGLNHSNPMLSAYRHGVVRGAVNVWDTVNNASKLAILFLKPAYIPPNLLGNVGMLLTEQGFAAPKNLGRAAFSHSYASTDTIVKVDAALGEGTFTVLGADGGHLAGAVQGLARGFGKIVDVVPRRAAFFHEAGLEGYGVPPAALNRLRARMGRQELPPASPHSIDDLFTPGHEQALERVTQRANAQIIDYGDLSPLERHIIRRAIFFYPWVKGATRWTVRWMTEHPGQVAVLNALGEQAQAKQRAILGPDLPTWAEGLIPVGQKGGLPTTVNPVGLTTLGTAADVLRASSALLHGGNQGAAESVSGFLPPAATIAGDTPSKGLPGAIKDQVQNFPPVTALGFGRDSATFPSKNTREERLLQWLLSGSFAPRQTSPAALAKSARNQKRKR